jgi:4-amino-4-deoxy-L-arabinose transferase-like glycosyltransferase
LGLSWDEASFVYNGWAISLWHRDEFANFMPLVFRSYGDYKPPLLVYTLAVVYKIFGLKVLTIRVISAISGVISVLGIYKLGTILKPKLVHFSVLAMLLAGLSPWAIHFSRLGYEANIAVLFVILGSIFLLKGKKNANYWFLAALLFALSLYSFHNTKITVPVLIGGFTILNWAFVKSKLKKAVAAGLLFLLLALPMLYATVYFGAGERGKQTLIFYEGDRLAPLTEVIPELMGNLANQLSVGFWIEGWDSVSIRHMTPGAGVIYSIELAFLVMGLVVLIKSKAENDKYLILWFVAGLLPAILTHNTPHAVRSYMAMPAVILIIANGIWSFGLWMRKLLGRKALVVYLLLGGAYFLNVSSYLKTYYEVYAATSATDFQYGYREVVDLVNKYKNGIEKIVVSDKYGQPYIYFLIYNQITPQQFLFGALSLFEFREINWPEKSENTLYVATPEEISPADLGVIEVISVPNTNRPVFVIAETK